MEEETRQRLVHCKALLAEISHQHNQVENGPHKEELARNIAENARAIVIHQDLLARMVWWRETRKWLAKSAREWLAVAREVLDKFILKPFEKRKRAYGSHTH